jgi:hypothetical protein
MPTGGCEVKAEQPSDPSSYPVRFTPVLGNSIFAAPDYLPWLLEAAMPWRRTRLLNRVALT